MTITDRQAMRADFEAWAVTGLQGVTSAWAFSRKDVMFGLVYGPEKHSRTYVVDDVEAAFRAYCFVKSTNAGSCVISGKVDLPAALYPGAALEAAEAARGEAQDSNVIALAKKAIGYWADGEMVDGYASAMVELEAAITAAPSSAEQPATRDDPHEFGAGIVQSPGARYWQKRSAEWMGRATALGWREHRDACQEAGTDPDATTVSAPADARDGEDARRWRKVRPFFVVDDIGDTETCIGLVVRGEALAEAANAGPLPQNWDMTADQIIDLMPADRAMGGE